MDLYSILNPTSKLGNTSYHLVQLSKELIDDINKDDNTKDDNTNNNNNTMSDNEKLLIKYQVLESHQFKSTDFLSTPYLTTINSTFKLRQQNHSNCVMLLNDNKSILNFNNYLIMEKQNMSQLNNIKLNFKDINIIELKSFTELNDSNNEYNDDDDDLNCVTIKNLNNIFKSCKKLFENTPISIVEFDSLLIFNGLIPNFNSLIKINSNLEMLILNLILSFIPNDNDNDGNGNFLLSSFSNNQIEQIINQSSEKIYKKFKILKNQHLIKRIIINVWKRYTINEDNEDNNKENNDFQTLDQYIYYSLSNNFKSKLNHNKIIKFLTMTILRKEKKILLNDLLIQIRLNLPSNYLPNFEINEILNGFSYLKKLDNNEIEINYLLPDQLTIFKNPKERFEKLFTFKNQWPIEEIQPFIISLNTKGIKIDKFCLKYCRVKKIKNRTVLMRR